jgi:glyoxylase I family protein
MSILGVHHIAIICGDYPKSKWFYTEVLGLAVISEIYRKLRHSYKLDLAVPNGSQIELFSFPNPPIRPSYPEACGLRHLAFAVDDIESELARIKGFGIAVESVRVDELTGMRFAFFADPDGLPIELYETKKAASIEVGT